MSVSDRISSSDKIFALRAEREIYKIKKVSRQYEVPFVAGYSRDRKTIYIDSKMPTGFKCKNGEFYETDKYLCIHEFVEDSCENNGASYLLAHSLATLAEERAVEDDGVDLEEYNDFMAKEVDKIGSRKHYTNLPPDLDTQPYYQDGESKRILKAMGYING
ncbi:MAG: hypothetical protein ACREQ5_04260 [Candidatus Dormibacteria bacterium]